MLFISSWFWLFTATDVTSGLTQPRCVNSLTVNFHRTWLLLLCIQISDHIQLEYNKNHRNCFLASQVLLYLCLWYCSLITCHVIWHSPCLEMLISVRLITVCRPWRVCKRNWHWKHKARPVGDERLCQGWVSVRRVQPARLGAFPVCWVPAVGVVSV